MLTEVKFYNVSINMPKTNRLYTYRIPLKMKLKENDLALVYVDQQESWQIVQIINTYNEIKYTGTIALHDLKYIRAKVDFSLYNVTIAKKERRTQLAKKIDEMYEKASKLELLTIMAKTHPELEELIKEYKELDGEL